MGKRHEQKSQRKTYTWPTSTWENAPHHLLPGKYTSKPQWDTTSHQWEWGKLTRQETTNVREDGRKGNPLYCWWECELVQPLWKTVWRFLKELKIELPNCITGYLPQRYRCSEMSGHLYPNVYSSNVHNSQTVEGASVSTERWMDKEDVVYVYNGIFLSH